jgi:hypothetical protein
MTEGRNLRATLLNSGSVLVLEKTGIPAEITGSGCHEQESPAARTAGSG